MPFWKKKTPKQPLWKIRTKVAHEKGEVLVKSRQVKSRGKEVFKNIYTWIKNYIRTVGWLFLGGLFVLGILVIYTTPIFSLKPNRIEIVLKPEPVFDKTAIMSILRDFAGRNIFSISTKEVFTSLSSNVRHIASVEKTLLMPDGMRVTITSFPASYRAFIGEEKFLLTENGQLIPDIPEVEAPALQIYHLVQDPNVTKKTPIMDEDMYAMRIILNAWKASMTTSSIDELRFYEQEKELHIVTKGTHCIFSLENGGKEVELLAKLITKGNVVLSRLSYIDMRIPNRVYTCAQSENVCLNNLKTIYGN